MSVLLYADDHEHMRLMVRDLLEASGHDVLLAADGRIALRRLAEQTPDLLILDYNMPGLTGIDVCRAVKSNPFTAHVPILMLTAAADVEDKVEGFEAGADDYLAKPFDPRELRARVAALLRLVKRESDRNPTSGFPGGRAIEEAIAMRVERGEPFAVSYFDIDHFKPFADTFGFAAADAAIRGTAAAIQEAAVHVGADENFVGHIGGDDFIAVTGAAEAEAVARDVEQRFRKAIAGIVGSEVAERGSYEGLDREGRARRFPVSAISTAVLLVHPESWTTLTALGAAAADAKRRAKQAGGGIVIHTV